MFKDRDFKECKNCNGYGHINMINIFDRKKKEQLTCEHCKGLGKVQRK